MKFTDQMMREVRLDKPPSRIISLVPSITELLSDLGLDDQIAGITKFCIHPEHIFKTKCRVGGTKNVSHELIEIINPDLVIANKEENIQSDILLLEKKYPVWISEVNTLEDATTMISRLGELTQRSEQAEKINAGILNQFRSIRALPEINALYLIWKNPYMAAGKNTFIDDMMCRCGFVNAASEYSRYPELTVSKIKEINPSVILLSSEPFPFSQQHVMEIKAMLPDSKVLLADGTFFSWYGSRLSGSPRYFNQLTGEINNLYSHHQHEN